jgi:hypothetical protein
MRRSILVGLVCCVFGCVGGQNAGVGPGDEPGPGGSGGGGGGGGGGGNEPLGPILACSLEGDGTCSIAFGTHAVGAAASALLTVCNRGDEEARIAGADTAWPFAAEVASGTIAPGSCAEAVHVAFTPGRDGAAEGRLALRYQRGVLDAALFGEGDAPAFDCNLEAPDEPYWPGPSDLNLPPDGISTGFACRNRTGLDAVLSLYLDGDPEVFSPAEQRVDLAAGARGEFWYTMASTRTGSFTATLRLVSESGGSREPVEILPITVRFPEHPVTCTGLLDFGTVPVGRFATRTVWCESILDLDVLTEPTITGDAASDFSTTRIWIPARAEDGSAGRAEADVTFIPSAPGSAAASLSLGDVYEPAQFELRGTGIAP